MKILYDDQIFNQQVFGGISRYFVELINELKKIKNFSYNLPISFSNNFYLKKLGLKNLKPFLPELCFRGQSQIIRLLNMSSSLINRNTNEFDIFHPTYYEPSFSSNYFKQPMVVTVYDMIHEKFSLDKSLLGSLTKKKKTIVKKADKVIAISNSTKKDLVEIFDIPSNKIEVIHLANSLPSVNEPEQVPGMPQRYMLFVGERSFYKNFHNFVVAATEFLRKDCNLHIVAAGGKGFSEKELRWIEELDIKQQVIHKKLDDQSLAFYYKKALCFVFPSKYEGFGIPILEAFACGCPLICSNTSSFPEVAGDAAIYFEPNQIESITQALAKVLNNKSIRQEMVERGYTQSQKFSWKMTAQKTFELYQSLLGKT